MSTTASFYCFKTHLFWNKTVLLRERKRHTARRVASTRSVILGGGGGTYPGGGGTNPGGGGTYPGGGVPTLVGGYLPWWGVGGT